MRWLGILAILAYRCFIRPFRRRQCLHAESCSTFGIRIMRERGLIDAAPAIRERVRSCRMPVGAAFIIAPDGQPLVLNGEIPPRALEMLVAQARRDRWT
jgi:putative component of membrane protein insertase Oxa1/YidC/SpoIIIJ protein YidD